MRVCVCIRLGLRFRDWELELRRWWEWATSKTRVQGLGFRVEVLLQLIFHSVSTCAFNFRQSYFIRLAPMHSISDILARDDKATV